MAEHTNIAWADATWNPHRGCTEFGPGCLGCYAKARDLRYESGRDATEPAHFGKGKPRIRASQHTLNLPFRMQAKIEKGVIPANKNKVFTLSLGDWADDEIDPAWRAEMWDTIRKTPKLRYLLVTKRAANMFKFLPKDWRANFRHCGVILTTVNQKELDRDAEFLREVKHGTTWVGLSVEPQLGPINFVGYSDFIDWVITGGDSLQDPNLAPRPYHVEWAEDIIAQGNATRTAVFVKQLGSNPHLGGLPLTKNPTRDANSDPSKWPPQLRVQQFPEALL